MSIMKKRAIQFCNEIESQGAKTFKIEWTKDKDRCYNARIMHYGKKIAHAGGCGYDKTSAVLADALQFLGETIVHSNGCGESSVMAHCKKYGWNLKRVIEDVYTIEMIKA